MLFSDSRWCLCLEFWIWDPVHHEVVFPIVWERLHNLPSYFMRVYTSPLYSLECHAEVCDELLEFALCNSQLPASWIFFAACSLRLLSLCESFACTSRPCTSSFDQLRLSDVRVKKFHVCNFDLGFPRIAPNAFFKHRLARNDGVDTVCQNSFLRRGQHNSEYSAFCSSFNKFDASPSSVSWDL